MKTHPIPAAPKRKGHVRMADVPALLLKDLNAGRCEAVTLTEGLAMDHGLLLQALFPKASTALKAAVTEAQQKLKITQRMRVIAAALNTELETTETLTRLKNHRSDTARGWAAYLICVQPWELEQKLLALADLADDPNPGVREWAWLAVRPQLVKEIEPALQLLIPWTTHRSENIRRYASEATRPRGVWCEHIPWLKDHPEHALPLLKALKADPSRYVQNSVANWLNDAGKTQPTWLVNLCQDWLQDSPDSAATRYICRRAQRSLKA
jgi:3-methyladenine DNA glycosylase AlkC